MRLGVAMIGEWARVRTVFSNQGIRGFVTRDWPKMASKAVRIVARSIREEAKSTSLKPNSVVTIALKGSNIPLVDTKQLMGSIIEKKISTDEYYGGIDPAARHAESGVPIWVIALRQNSGYVIPVTAALRNRIAAAGFRVNAATKAFVVPARPFLTIGLDKGIRKVIGMIQTLPAGMREDFSRIMGLR